LEFSLTFFPDQGSILLDLGGDSQEGQRKESEMEIFPKGECRGCGNLDNLYQGLCPDCWRNEYQKREGVSEKSSDDDDDDYPNAILAFTLPNGDRVVDLEPESSELWAVWIDASLRDLDPRTLDLDHLPKGVKWVTDAEWEDIEGRLVGQ
jgi:hypothetical protein